MPNDVVRQDDLGDDCIGEFAQLASVSLTQMYVFGNAQVPHHSVSEVAIQTISGAVTIVRIPRSITPGVRVTTHSPTQSLRFLEGDRSSLALATYCVHLPLRHDPPGHSELEKH
jgi:hypothetical protein